MLASLATGISHQATAVTFGVYDPRTMGMGGTSVANAPTHHAHYYNPALLGFGKEIEEESRNGRFIFPNIVAQYNKDSLDQASDIVDEEYADQITAVVDAYNGTNSVESASEIARISTELNNALQDYGDKNVNGEIFLGLSVSEPAKSEGGSFFIGARVIGVADPDITDNDFALLDDYIELANFIVPGGEAGAPHPELIDGDGNIIDPRDALTSEARVAAVGILEWGVSAATSATYNKLQISIGITPKLKRTEIYSESVEIDQGTDDLDEDTNIKHSLNADLGFAIDYDERFRIGVSVKDVINESFEGLDLRRFELKPRARMGLAYTHRFVQFAIDYDLTKNDVLDDSLASQEMAFGLEFTPFSSLGFQLGYRENTASVESDTALSYGVRYRLGRFVSEISYMSGDQVEGGGVVLGWAF